MKRIVILSAVMLLFTTPVWAQAVSGIRGVNGGVAALHNLTGSTSSLYIDGQGTQGFLSNPAGNGGAFESYIFKTPNGPTWIGSMTTLGPQLNPGLIAGGVQSSFNASTGTFQLLSSPTVIPAPPRQLPPLPAIESSLLDDIP
ncbi:MAG TPA: hypothetical protein VL261_15490 [Nitrospira sp.]|jgi:hypothetical protein|nr:hypothetical protein [Nitrospira sp.]